MKIAGRETADNGAMGRTWLKRYNARRKRELQPFSCDAKYKSSLICDEQLFDNHGQRLIYIHHNRSVQGRNRSSHEASTQLYR